MSQSSRTLRKIVRIKNNEKLQQHLVKVLERRNFPKAERFVSQSLNQGKLLLLFDGLDEVNTDVRRQTVQAIKHLLQQYPKCPTVITCRTAVYNNEFIDVVNQTLEVVEFSDLQIRLFLKSWESQMPPEKSINQLLQTLRDKPRIMTLARNPLLLTIIAYLYCDTPFVLPDSRAGFYRKSTNVLLELRDEERGIANQYRSNDKGRVLKNLALYIQDNAQSQRQDRRSINYETILEQIREVLPGLSLDINKDTKSILQEIVERSGLFRPIDFAGDKYQFAHLSIQEFFAAEALKDNWLQLIKLYRKEPDAWRETVKLWCGLAENSTELIKAVYAEDALLAFECLADAKDVKPNLAESIIDQFKNQLGKSNNEDNLAKAFGAVAASSRERGQAVFDFLKEVLTLETEPLNRRRAGAIALSMTNLPQAAKVLANQYDSQADEIRESLVRMGDLAIPELVSKAQEGYLEALNDLLAIATPDAANALVPFLWHDERELASLAAWNLATLMPQFDIEESLHNFPLTEEQRKADYLDWVWQPFPTPTNSALPIIAGRIAYLLKQAPLSAIPTLEQNLDPRVIIPLCAIELVNQGEFKNRWNSEGDDLLAQQEPTPELDREMRKLIKKLLKDKTTHSLWSFLFSSLAPRLQLDLLRRLSNYDPPTKDHWHDLFLEIEYEFKNSRRYQCVLFWSLAMSMLAIVGIVQIIFSQPENWSNGLLGLAILVVFVFWNVLWRGIEEKLEPTTFISFGLFGALTFWRELRRLFREKIVWAGVESLMSSFDYSENRKLMTGAVAAVAAVTMAGVMAETMAVTVAMIVAYFGAWVWAYVGAGVWGYVGAGVFTVIVAMVVAYFGAVAYVVAVAGAVAGAGAGAGVGAWVRAKDKQDFGKFLAVFAFPFFCWSPIVVGFSILALLQFSYREYTLLAWLALTGLVTRFWLRGQKLEEQARNPLKGILDQTERLN